MEKGGKILTCRKQPLTDLLLDVLGFESETLILQLGSQVELSSGKDAPSQGELNYIFLFLRLMM